MADLKDREVYKEEKNEDAPEGRKNSSIKSKELKNSLFGGRIIKLFCFMLILFGGMLVSLIIPLRPKVSELEKRELTKFPKLTAETLVSGGFFDGVNTWFADTFPFRESLISLNKSVQGIYIGSSDTQIVGTVETGDDIPDASEATVTESEKPKTDTAAEDKKKEKKEIPVIDAKGEAQTFGAVLLEGDSAFEYYYFYQKTADIYSAAVNEAASDLAGQVNVYDMIVPTSMGITLPDSLRDTVGSQDQEKGISYMYASMNDNVKKVDIYRRLMEHRDEYIYFRTDHHWTALGAYYAYEQFAEDSGKQPISLSEYNERTFEGFLGSFYSATDQSSALEANPDTVIAYDPKIDVTVTITDQDGNTFEWFLVSDVSDYGSGAKYSTFIGGDNPFTVIRNNDLHDGSSIAVVKESFGNAFVPFLAEHYETVYVIDYRSWNGDITDFAKENNLDDLLFINNISATTSETLMGRLEGIV